MASWTMDRGLCEIRDKSNSEKYICKTKEICSTYLQGNICFLEIQIVWRSQCDLKNAEKIVMWLWDRSKRKQRKYIESNLDGENQNI